MSELDERLRAMRERFENTRPRSLSNAIEWHSAYRDLETLLAVVEKLRDQRDYFMSQSGFKDGKGLEMRKLREDAALAKILESGE